MEAEDIAYSAERVIYLYKLFSPNQTLYATTVRLQYGKDGYPNPEVWGYSVKISTRESLPLCCTHLVFSLLTKSLFGQEPSDI